MRKIKLFYVFLNLITFNAFSQPERRESYDIKSPNVSDFIRYGNIQTNMYVGELNLSIPILNVPVTGQSPLDLSLSYNASGFIPNKRSGIVGLNWNLNGIGMISREVREVPDDHIGAPTVLNGQNGRFAHGFIVGMQYLKSAGGALPNGQLENAHPQPTSNNFDIRFYDAVGSNNNGFETAPDIFNFNVNGLSGKFFMTSDGKIKIISNSPDPIFVDLSNFNFQPPTVNCAPINFSEFKLIDSKGNKYFFGGESKYLEYTLNYNRSGQSGDGTASNPVINTWYIKKIEYYNGIVTYFNYQDDKIINGETTFCSNPIIWFKGDNRNSNYKRLFFMTESVNDSRSLIKDNYTGISNALGGSGNVYTLHKKAFLESITSNNFSVFFNYSEQGYIFNNNPNLYAFFKSIDEFKLSKIELKVGSQLIKEINFSYLLKGGTASAGSYPRLFLDKIQETGKSPYQFEYDIQQTQNLPVPSTCAVDFWGFYNGKNSNNAPPFGYSQLIPQSNVDSNGDQTFISNIRNPDFTSSKMGILKKVTYPTGGQSIFEYEPHVYGKRLERKSVGNFFPALYNVTGTAGGVRIKKITEFDGIKVENIKEYKYLTLDNSSSGILMQWPRTRFEYNVQSSTSSCWINAMWFDGYSTNYDIATMQSSSINMNSIENSVMTYSSVTENTVNKGYKIFNFKNYINYPDNSDITNFQPTISIGNLCGDILQRTFSPANLVKNFYVMFNDRSIERGKLENTLIYDADNKLLLKEEYLYNTDANRFTSNSSCAKTSNDYWYGNKQYYYSDYQTKKTTTNYFNTGSIVTIESSEYTAAPSYFPLISDQQVLSKSTSTNSSNDVIVKNYKYPWHSYTNASTDFLNFKNANILTPIREIVTKNGVTLLENFTVYAKDATTSNFVLPKFSYSAKFPNNFQTITNVGNLEKKVTYDSYDSSGNVIQYTQADGIPVSLIWGYNQSLLIAKLENVSYSTIPSTLISNLQTLSNADVDNSTELSLLNALNPLRTNFPSGFITSYTYNPFVGVTSITDTKGYLIRYFYDNAGRLKEIKDSNDNVISQFQYHYKNQ